MVCDANSSRLTGLPVNPLTAALAAVFSSAECDATATSFFVNTGGFELVANLQRNQCSGDLLTYSSSIEFYRVHRQPFLLIESQLVRRQF